MAGPAAPKGGVICKRLQWFGTGMRERTSPAPCGELHADAFGLALVEAKYGNVAGTGRFFRRLPDATADVTDEFASYRAIHP